MAKYIELFFNIERKNFEGKWWVWCWKKALRKEKDEGWLKFRSVTSLSKKVFLPKREILNTEKSFQYTFIFFNQVFIFRMFSLRFKLEIFNFLKDNSFLKSLKKQINSTFMRKTFCLFTFQEETKRALTYIQDDFEWW